MVGACTHPSARRRQTPNTKPAASAYVSEEDRRQSPWAGMASGNQRQINPANPANAPTAPRPAIASAASSRARPNNGRTAANAAAKATMLAPSGRKSVPAPAVTDRMYHHKARRARLARANGLQRTGGAATNAAITNDT